MIVNLANLRSMIDGDRDMEAMLFAEFNRAFVEGMGILSNHVQPGGEAHWRTQAHALKGIALNLGAFSLSALCKKAQDESQMPANEKILLLEEIRENYMQVRRFLDQEMSACQ